MNTLRKVWFAAGLSALAASASADLPKFWSTGEGLSSGAADSHWIVEKVQGSTSFAGPGPAYVMDSSSFPVLGAYTNRDYTNSKWVSFSADAYCNNDDIFRFTQRFYIDPGFGGMIVVPDAMRLQFTGLFSSDNASEMRVNGTLLAGLPYYEPVGGYSFEARKRFDASHLLRQGWNEVSYLVGSANTMGANVGPITEWMGLRVEGKIELVPVPEPATIAGIGIGCASLVRRARRKR